MSVKPSAVCRWCGANPAKDPKAALRRVNEKGVPGIWECYERSCEACGAIRHCTEGKTWVNPLGGPSRWLCADCEYTCQTVAERLLRKRVN